MKFNIKDIKEGYIVDYEYKDSNSIFYIKDALCVSKKKNSITFIVFYNSSYKVVNKPTKNYMVQIWDIISPNILINNIKTENYCSKKQTKKYYQY